MKKFTVNENTTLKNFTDATYPQGSFAFNALLKKGDIRVNGIKQRANCAVAAGDEIVYYTSPAQEAKPSHSAVYEDVNIFIADKLSGVSSEALFCELKESGCLPVHRLDRNTCGLIVLAKTAEAQTQLLEAFKERAVEKIYMCLAKNAFKAENGVLTAYASKNAESGTVRVYGSPADGRVKMVTEYEVLNKRGDIALVKVTLHTGKTHQIRAHLAHIGCPVLGDSKYGDFALNKKYGLTKQVLVSHSLRFNLAGNLSYLNGKIFISGFSVENFLKR
ncbi:MAG: RluA family pseudouridine synthase [Clostridia bacterium]|nr:RluA family pseudouridine synthase [Clostridia bacterium]